VLENWIFRREISVIDAINACHKAWVMDIRRWIFGWDWKIRKLRKKWDDIREGSLKKKGRLRRTLLEKLDRTEERLRMLEERKMSRWDRARFCKEIEIDLEEVKSLKDIKAEEYEEIQAQRRKDHPSSL
jgi:hypothetical protein